MWGPPPQLHPSRHRPSLPLRQFLRGQRWRGVFISASPLLSARHHAQVEEPTSRRSSHPTGQERSHAISHVGGGFPCLISHARNSIQASLLSQLPLKDYDTMRLVYAHFRPDAVPEFDSVKSLSIGADVSEGKSLGIGISVPGFVASLLFKFCHSCFNVPLIWVLRAFWVDASQGCHCLDLNSASCDPFYTSL